jgi:hypothetical protein
MCAEHHALLVRAVGPPAKKPGERAISAGVEPAPVITRHVAPRPAPAAPAAARAPREERALRLARRVQEVGRVSRVDAADAAGVKPSALRLIVNYAVAQGWVRGMRGPGGGYAPGDVVPPTENTNMTAAA